MGWLVMKCSFPPSLSTVALPGEGLLLTVENGAPSGLAGLLTVLTDASGLAL